MAGIELVPLRVELFGGSALMRFARIGGAAAPNHCSRPLLAPETVELDGAFVNPDRVQGIAIQRPAARLRVEVGEQPIFGVLARRAGSKPTRHRGRALYDVANPLAVEQR